MQSRAGLDGRTVIERVRTHDSLLSPRTITPAAVLAIEEQPEPGCAVTRTVLHWGGVKTEWQGRISQAAAKYGETAPMAATCCNACRTCVQTNAITAALAVAIAAGSAIPRLGRRDLRRG